MSDSRTRHANALLMPATPEERTLSRLFVELGIIADRYKDDSVMLRAVESLGATLMRLLDGDTGRVDQSHLRKQIEDTITRAGGDLDAL